MRRRLTHREEQQYIDACKAGDVETVQRLIDSGADPRIGGDGPLLLACMYSRLPLLKYLISNNLVSYHRRDVRAILCAVEDTPLDDTPARAIDVVRYLVRQNAMLPMTCPTGSGWLGGRVSAPDILAYLTYCVRHDRRISRELLDASYDSVEAKALLESTYQHRIPLCDTDVQAVLRHATQRTVVKL